MFKKKKGFFSKLFRKASMSSGVTITIISIAAIGTILYGASHFSKAYNDSKFLSELPNIKTPAELLGKAGGNNYNYVGYTNSKSVDNMIKQIKNATPNVGNGGNNNNDGNRIIIYNSDVSGSGNLTQNDNDVLEKTKAYVIFLKNRKFPKELEGLYKYYGYTSGYNVYNVKTNGAFVSLILGNSGSGSSAGTLFTESSDGVCNSNGDDYGLSTGSDNTYSKIFYLDNTEDPDCVYLALHDKDNFASDVKFVLNTDLNFSGANMDYDTLNDNLDLSSYNSTGDTFLPMGGRDNYGSAGGRWEFKATFSGNNYKITIGNINYSDSGYIGFFGDIGTDGKISDLSLEIGNISGGDNHVGGFVGYNKGTISNSSVNLNNVNDSKSDVGGFVGFNDNGTISNSSAIISLVNGKGSVGGFVGDNDGGTIQNSSVNSDNVSGSDDRVGGFVGDNDGGTIQNSSANVNNISSSSNWVGGFVARNDGTISNSSATNSLVNGNNGVGGFVGDNYGGTTSYSSVVADNISGADYIGGFAGKNNSTIENSLVVADNISGSDNNVGGFVGENVNGTIQKSSTVVDTVSTIGNSIGGFAGHNYKGAIKKSSAITSLVKGKYYVGGFVGYNKDCSISGASAVVNSVDGEDGYSSIKGFVGNNDGGTYDESVTKILDLDNNSDVDAGYYENDNSFTNSTSIFTKEEFFFDDTNRDNDGLQYDGNNQSLTITVPADKTFNAGNFPSAFSSANNNWGQNHILDNLNNYWTNW